MFLAACRSLFRQWRVPCRDRALDLCWQAYRAGTMLAHATGVMSIVSIVVHVVSVAIVASSDVYDTDVWKDSTVYGIVTHKLGQGGALFILALILDAVTAVMFLVAPCCDRVRGLDVIAGLAKLCSVLDLCECV